MMPEEWREIPGYEGYYEVSSIGNVRRVTATSYGPAGRLLKLRTNRDGYPIVFLSVKSRQRFFKVHRLVALAFLGPGEEGMEVCHNDGNPANNNADNLRWASHRENMRDMVRHGAPHLKPKNVCKKGLHPMTPETTVRNGSQRLCGECHRAYQRRRYAAMKEEGA